MASQPEAYYVGEVRNDKEAEARLRALSDASFEALVLSEGGRIIDANQRAVELFGGTRPDDLIGRATEEWASPNGVDLIDRVPSEKPEVSYEIEVLRFDGTRIPVEMRARMIEYRGRLLCVTSLRDISGRREVEEALRREKAFTQLLQEVAVAANEAATVEGVLQFALDRICAFTGWPVGHAYLSEMQAGTRRLIPSSLWHLDVPARYERFRRVTEQTTFDPGEGLPGRVLSTGRPAWIMDVTDEANFPRARLVEHLGVHAGFAFPILVADDVVAVLEFYAGEAAPPDEKLLAVMGHIGRQLGHVVERKQVARQLRASEERYRTLTHSAVVAIVTTDADGLVQDWNRWAEQLFGYTYDEVVGQSIEMIMPRRYVEGHRRGMQRVQEGGERRVIGRTVELHGVRKSGEEFPLELSLSEWQAGGKLFITGFLQDITERKRTEEALRRSEIRNRAILDALPDALVQLDAEGMYLDVRLPAGYAAVVDEASIRGKRIEEVLPPRLARQARENLDRALATGAVQTFEYDIEVDGEMRRREARVVPYGDDEALSIQRDITERRRAEEALRESEQQLRRAQEVAHLGSWEWDVETGALGWSDELYRIYGLEPGSGITFECYRERLHPEDREALLRTVEQAMQTHEPYTIYHRIVRSSGEERIIRGDGEVVAGDDGTVLKLFGTALDVTDTWRAQEDLKASRALLAGVLRSSLDGIMAFEAVRNEDGTIVDFEWLLTNPAGARIVQREEKDLVGKRMLEEMPLNKDLGLFDRYVEVVETGRPYHEEIHVQVGGVEIWLDVAAAKLDDGITVTFQDVTERKETEEWLRLLEAAVSASLDGITIADMEAPDHPLVYVSPGFEEMTGYDADEIAGRNCRFLQGDDRDQPAINELRAAVTAGRECRVTLRNYRKDGSLFWNELTLYPLHDAAGTLTHYVGIQRDVTERIEALQTIRALNEDLEWRVTERTARLREMNKELRRNEAELRVLNETLEERVEVRTRALERTNQALQQRNRELQDFAYVASHDLQEPLRKVRAFADLMREDYSDAVDETGHYYLSRIHDAAERMANLISDLLAFSRVTTRGNPFADTDLNTVVAEVLSDLEVQIAEKAATIEIGDLPVIEADATQLRQVLQNLMANALKFHKAGQPPVVRIEAAVEEGRRGAVCRLTVADNGIGFDEKYLKRIFTPFQRLHGRGKYTGTGMGLAICRRIIERHNGTITAQSTPGEGATFILTLPVHQPEHQSEDDSI